MALDHTGAGAYVGIGSGAAGAGCGGDAGGADAAAASAAAGCNVDGSCSSWLLLLITPSMDMLPLDQSRQVGQAGGAGVGGLRASVQCASAAGSATPTSVQALSTP